ncbi:MAG: ParB/RepB/Spo0J family partition protein [Thermodesulfobacteriota bacterium]
MPINSRFQEISLTAVAWEDCSFRFSPPGDLTRLKESLQEVGLLAPPRLRRQNGERYQVITGWKRLWAAAQLDWDTVPALTLPGDTPEASCLLLIIHDNALSRGFNPLEQALLAPRLLAHWDRETVVRRFLPLLGVPPTAGHLERLLAAGALEAPWQTLLAQERLALSAAARLARWPEPEREASRPFFEQLPLSQSKQEEFLETIDLLARREGRTPARILSRPELQQYLTQADLTPQEKAGAVRRLLKGWLLPRLSAAEETFQAGLKRLGLKQHPRLRLTPPPAFEGQDFQVEIKFRDAAELRQLLTELARLAGEEEFSKLTDH